MEFGKDKNKYCLILCGGSGTRLWPFSKEILPKQFVPFIDGKSLMELTIERNMNSFLKEHIFFVTDESNKFHTSLAVKKYGIEEKNILVEPSAKDTCAAVALGMSYIKTLNSDSMVFVCPSDHKVPPEFDIHTILSQDADFIIFGIEPDNPNTNYGYIKVDDTKKSFQLVSEFKEKPDYKTAEKYIQSNQYLWNSGMFYFDNREFFKKLKQFNSSINSLIEKTAITDKDSLFTEFEKDSYNKIDPISLDYALIENLEEIYVAKFEESWSDLGNWNELFNFLNQNGKYLDKSIFKDNCKNVNTYNDTQQSISLSGLENLNIINTRDDLFITNNQKELDFKNLHKNIFKHKKKINFEESKDYRPWGWFENLLDLENYKVKRLCVYPKSRLSLQKHFKRSEHWVVVSGIGNITKGEDEFVLKAGESVFLEKEEIHRIDNSYAEDLIIIETQIGECIEDDIVRFEDDFNRS